MNTAKIVVKMFAEIYAEMNKITEIWYNSSIKYFRILRKKEDLHL